MHLTDSSILLTYTSKIAKIMYTRKSLWSIYVHRFLAYAMYCTRKSSRDVIGGASIQRGWSYDPCELLQKQIFFVFCKEKNDESRLMTLIKYMCYQIDPCK